ncbi:MAG TPA: thiamine phosphate synthase [Vicinamibacterales bacterium]
MPAAELPPLYVICDQDACERAGWRLVDFADACMDGGATLLQLRAKHAGGRALLAAADEVVRRANEVSARVVLNDRADIAALAGAHGVHVGQEDLSPADVRRVTGDAALVGLSTHTTAQFGDGLRSPSDYLAIGPVFATASKATGYEAVGLERVREVSALADGRTTIVAIGGITLESAASVIAAGARSVAVIGDLLAGGDPAARVRKYLELLKV